MAGTCLSETGREGFGGVFTCRGRYSRLQQCNRKREKRDNMRGGKIQKGIVGLAVVAIAGLTVSACGSGSSAKPAAKASAPVTARAPAPTTTVAPAPAPAPAPTTRAPAPTTLSCAELFANPAYQNLSSPSAQVDTLVANACTPSELQVEVTQYIGAQYVAMAPGFTQELVGKICPVNPGTKLCVGWSAS
jgi:hypothetical protein